VQLTAIEYRLLRELAMNAGRVLTYENLLRRVWGVTHSGDIRPMRTVISNLRHKLGDDAKEPALILTEPRVGYRMLSGRRGAD
ncbi:MAG: winged helix-turn-helix domain-containing protein, partial [Chloroflexota bacterium]|nr:winged helix-turn-helix domain-containing protein [Chloroflexota bacterium]